MTETATLIFHRKHRWVYALRKFDIVIDDKKVGSIGNNKTEEITIPAGEHTIELRLSWILKSKSQTITIAPGQTQTLTCYCPQGFWKIYIIIFLITLMLINQYIYRSSYLEFLYFSPFKEIYLLFLIVFGTVFMIYSLKRGFWIRLEEPDAAVTSN